MRVSSIIRRASTGLSGGRLTEKSAKPFGADAARAEHDDRAELAVLLHAEDQLVVDLAHHLLDRDALDGRIGRALPHAGEHLGVAALEVRARAQAEFDAAGRVLVGDLVRHDLEDDRVAELLRRDERLVDALHDPLRDHRHAVRHEEALRLLLREHEASGLRGPAQHRLEVVPRRGDVDR